MYNCPKHGKLEDEWCEECNEIYRCDCTDTDTTKTKHIGFYDSENDSYMYMDITICFCKSCHSILRIEKYEF
jgi:hypothetical protein